MVSIFVPPVGERRSVPDEIRAEQHKQSATPPNNDRQQPIQRDGSHKHLIESNEQCHHAADLCLCQILQPWNGNREAVGLGVSAHTGQCVSTRINVLLKLPEATWLVLRSGSSDTHSHIVLTSSSVSVTPLLTEIESFPIALLHTGRASAIVRYGS